MERGYPPTQDGALVPATTNEADRPGAYGNHAPSNTNVQPQYGNQPAYQPAYAPQPSNGNYQMQQSAPYAQPHEKPNGNGQIGYNKPDTQYFAPARPRWNDLWPVPLLSPPS